MKVTVYAHPRARAPMPAVNRLGVLLNHLAQQPINRAEPGENQGIPDLIEVVRRQHELQLGHEALAGFRFAWTRDGAGCSMLSCGS